MKKISKTYHIIVIISLAIILVSIKLLSYKSTPPSRIESNTNVILIDGKQLQDALCDICKLSGNKLTCSADILNKIIQNVDTSTIKEISNDFVVFNKNKGYLEIPATLMANMIDLKLFIK